MVTLEDISEAARERRRWESDRRGKGEGGMEGEGMDSERGGTGESGCWDGDR